MTDSTARNSPPPRRLSETRKVEHIRSDGTAISILGSVGYAENDPMRPVEVFYAEGFRSGADLEFLMQDACVLISILLQHGVPPERIAASMSTREEPDGKPSPGSLAGTIATELMVPPVWSGAKNGNDLPEWDELYPDGAIFTVHPDPSDEPDL